MHGTQPGQPRGRCYPLVTLGFRKRDNAPLRPPPLLHELAGTFYRPLEIAHSIAGSILSPDFHNSSRGHSLASAVLS